MVGPKQEERTIGDTTYRVTQLTAKPARRLFARIVQLLGPGIGSMMEGQPLSMQALLGADMGVGIKEITKALDPEEQEHVIDVLCENKTIARRDGDKWPIMNKEAFDLHFTGRLVDMYKVIGFALEVNYSDFLGGLSVRNSGQGETKEAAT